jgi:hypothetical protein
VSPTVATLLVAAATVCAALAASGERFEPVADDDLARDPRLGRPVTVECARVYVGDLVERIAAQTGTSLQADDATGASDRRVLVSVRGTPAWKVMASLPGLFSYRLALWRWERTGSGDAAQYRLTRTRGAQSCADRLAEEAQTEFERMTAERMAASYRSDDEWAQRLSDPTPVRIEERGGWGLQVFRTALPENVQTKVLRGEVRAVIPVEQLPAWGRRLVEDLYARTRPYRRLPDGGTEPVPFPGEVVAYTMADGYPTPSLFLEMGAMGGYCYAGGLPLKRAFAKRMAEAWFAGADHPEDGDQEAAKLAAAPRHDLDKRIARSDPRWVDLAEMTDVPMLAVAPVGRMSRSFASDRTATLGTYLAALRERDYAAHKWRHGVLLVTHAAWFRDRQEVSPCPWSVVRRLREDCRAGGGLPSLDGLIRVAVDLSPEQLDALSDDWEPAESLLAPRGAFQALDRDPELRRRLRDSGNATIKGPAARAAASSIPVVDISAVESVSLAVRTIGADDQRQLALDVFLYDRTGNRIGGNLPRFPIYPLPALNQVQPARP